MNPFIKSEKGVTLIELLCSIIILSIILVSFMSFFINSAKYNTNTSVKMNATNIAREIQNDFKVDPEKNQELKDLIVYSETSEATSIPKSNYPNLNLTQDILSNDGILTLTLQKQDFTIEVTVDTNGDSDPSVDKKLSKMHVLVKKNAKVLSETFTYFKNL